MKRTLLLCCISIFIAFATTAQTKIAGTWSGVLNVQDLFKIRLVLHIKDSSQELSAVAFSPDQGNAKISITEITYKDSILHFMAGNGAEFKGVYKNDTIKGTFYQLGKAIPLKLQRGVVTIQVPVRPQTPRPPFPYTIDSITFTNKAAGVELAGTLTLPKGKGKYPAVVLIAGSGKNDRNESIDGHKPLMVIADYLTRRGIAVLRYDKRGVGLSKGIYFTATTADFASDVEAAVRFLRKNPHINSEKIGLIGHSEGGIIAPIVAAKDKKIDFIVLLAGTGYNGADLLLMQEQAIGKANGLSKEKLKTIYQTNKQLFHIITSSSKDSVAIKLKQALRNNLSDTLAFTERARKVYGAFLQYYNPWMVYFLQYDPKTSLKKVDCPVLALGGSKDLQVPAKRNISAIRKALKKGGNNAVTTKIFNGLNHLFQEAKTGLPSEYSTINQTFSPEVLRFMNQWIQKQIQ